MTRALQAINELPSPLQASRKENRFCRFLGELEIAIERRSRDHFIPLAFPRLVNSLAPHLAFPVSPCSGTEPLCSCTQRARGSEMKAPEAVGQCRSLARATRGARGMRVARKKTDFDLQNRAKLEWHRSLSQGQSAPIFRCEKEHFLERKRTHGNSAAGGSSPVPSFPPIRQPPLGPCLRAPPRISSPRCCAPTVRQRTLMLDRHHCRDDVDDRTGGIAPAMSD